MLTIGEFSKICRVSPKTLRYYDQIGLLKPSQVSSDSGYRYYEVAPSKICCSSPDSSSISSRFPRSPR
jgi:hypothetical protein